MKFAFVEGTEVANAFAEVVPNDEAVVLKGLVLSRSTLFCKKYQNGDTKPCGPEILAK